MKTLRNISIGVATLLLGTLASSVFGEIAVELDKNGNYRHVLILQGMRGGKPIIWQGVRPGVQPRLLLNPNGDMVGDLSPDVRESPRNGLPWAVWSFNDGTDFDIAFSLFNGQQWVIPRLLETGDNSFHDLDPVLAFTRDGTPMVTWWQAAQIPRVLLSVFRGGEWSAPILVSDPRVDSRHPVLRVRGRNLTLHFKTENGPGNFTSLDSSLLNLEPTDCSDGLIACDISDGPDVDGSDDPPDVDVDDRWTK